MNTLFNITSIYCMLLYIYSLLNFPLIYFLFAYNINPLFNNIQLAHFLLVYFDQLLNSPLIYFLFVFINRPINDFLFIKPLLIHIHLPNLHGTKSRTFVYSPVLHTMIAWKPLNLALLPQYWFSWVLTKFLFFLSLIRFKWAITCPFKYLHLG